jgi:hypothetical protein
MNKWMSGLARGLKPCRAYRSCASAVASAQRRSPGAQDGRPRRRRGACRARDRGGPPRRRRRRGRRRSRDRSPPAQNRPADPRAHTAQTAASWRSSAEPAHAECLLTSRRSRGSGRCDRRQDEPDPWTPHTRPAQPTRGDPASPDSSRGGLPAHGVSRPVASKRGRQLRFCFELRGCWNASGSAAFSWTAVARALVRPRATAARTTEGAPRRASEP